MYFNVRYSNDGTKDRPFASIPRAIEAARGMDETVVINLRGAVIRLQEQLS